MKSILITGGAGFIGANLVKYMVAKYPEYKIVNLDALTYAADLNYLDEISSNSNYAFFEGDIRNKEDVESVFADYKITDVMHLAAESHVDNSVSSPEIFIHTNIVGTFNLLVAARENWAEDLQNHRFLHVSTDEVFGSTEDNFFTEETPYAPNSPYSASKASADMLVRCYHHTFGLNTVTTNCSNNYGPGQHDEKLIPVIIRKALTGEPIPIYGTGKNIRDWLYVEDHCLGLDLAFHSGGMGESYNIGTRNEWANLDLCKSICRMLDKIEPKSSSYENQITFVKDRPGHDFRYAIDSSKVEDELGFKAAKSFEEGLETTLRWYINKYKN